ncbi:MAG: outer-membrane lipoprotein carrier protein LolA [Spirochaetia bacterium]|jgi:outer membrane lipoprotein-sorting protein|nr:outer-membrane lipoprotein carrier protein LolA [Spirochaetia bacterium]
MKLKIIVASLLFIIPMPNFALTADEVMAKFRSRMYGAGSLSGTISWSYGTDMQYSGSFKYMPGKIYMKFNNPSGKIIVCNGKKLWIYNQSSSICGIQDMGGGSSGGIAGLLSGYNGIVTGQGGDGYTVKLSRPGGGGYSEIILRLDQTFFLKSVSMKDSSGNQLRFSITLDTGTVFSSQFEFSVPSNAQVIKNPLQIK